MYNHFWILKQQNLNKNEIDLASACSEDYDSRYKIKIWHLQAIL